MLSLLDNVAPATWTPLTCIAYMLYLAFIPRVLEVLLLTWYAPGGFDNVNPRYQREKKLLDDNLGRTHRRIRASHENSIEAFTFFSVATLCALHANVNPTLISSLGTLMIYTRVAFIICYIIGTTKLMSYVRSTIWVIGFALTLRLLSLAIE